MRRSWLALSLTALSLAAGCSEQPPSPTPTAKDCLGATALANHCPEPDGIQLDTGDSTACDRTEPLGLVEPCAFGPRDGEPFALLGDSHARQLRGAFDVLATTLGRRGYQLARNGCPFVRDGRALPEPERSRCARFKQQVPRWLARHPEIKTVFVIGLPRNAASADPANWTAAWQTLPSSVERLVVIRDTPEMAERTTDCTAQALERPGSRCAVARATALPPDPAVAAAAQVEAPVIDLTRLFCDDTRCFPVIGGLQAYQDQTHITSLYAISLGPYLIEEVRQLG